MGSKIVSVVVAYEDGHIEEFPNALVAQLTSRQGDHATLAGFVRELFHIWDIHYQLSLQEKLYRGMIEAIESEHEEEFEFYSKRNEENKVIQRAELKGQSLENWLPCLAEYPYSSGDIVAVYDTFDLLALEGRSVGRLAGIVFQEITTGKNSHRLDNESKQQLKGLIDSINDPRLQFEHWARRDKDSVFSLVKHHKG